MSLHGPSAPTNWTSFLLGEPLPTYYLASGFDHPAWPVVAMDDPRRFVLAGWGLVPHWIASEPDATAIRDKTLNARSETLFAKPAFRDAARTGRCLVLTSGFFESHKQAGRSYPFYCYLEGGRSFLLAGILARSRFAAAVGGSGASGAPREETGDLGLARDGARGDVAAASGGYGASGASGASGAPGLTFSVVTTPANELMSRVHNEKRRMPVIFESEERALRWLDRGLSPSAAGELLATREIPELRAHPVSRLVFARGGNKNVPEVRERVDYPELDPL